MIKKWSIFLLVSVICHGMWAQDKLPIKKSMLIFPPQHEHVHGSSIVALPNGDILAAWFQGSGERKADDVGIMGARLAKGAAKWSTPFLMADTYQLPDCNPVLFLNNKGKLFLVWIAVLANQWENSILISQTSDDYLKPGVPVWNNRENIFLKPDDSFADEVKKKMRQMPSTGAGWSAYAPKYDDQIIMASADPGKRSMGWMTRIHPLLLPGGRILLPLYSDGFNFSLTAISDDDGKTWRPSLPMVGRGNVQPSLILKKNGDILAYMRDNGDAPNRVQISTSADKGESWTVAQKTEIPNTASVEVVALKDGRWAFIGNVLTDGRHQISLWLSSDEGATWDTKMMLENEPAGEGSFSYPSMFQDDAGNIHISYSWQKGGNQKSIKYVVIDPNVK